MLIKIKSFLRLVCLFGAFFLSGCTLMHYDFGVGGGGSGLSANTWMSVSQLNDPNRRVKFVGKFFSMNLVYRGISGRVKKPNSLLVGTEDYLLRMCEARNTSICSNNFYLPWHKTETLKKLKRLGKITIKGTLVGVSRNQHIGISRSRTDSFDHVLMAEINPYSPRAYSGVNDSQGLTKDEIKLVQQQLNSSGFNVGAADGVLGSKTKAAVKVFQKSKGLTPDGVIGPKTMAALRQKNIDKSKEDNNFDKSEEKTSKEDIVVIKTESIPRKIQIINDTSLKSKPDLFSRTLKTISKGEALEAISQREGWYEVMYLNQKGFIHSSDSTPQ